MACDETAVKVTVLLATEHWPSEERPRHTIHRQKGWLLTFSAPSSCTMNFKQQRRKELETKVLKAGASISDFHTRTLKTQVSNLPQMAETSPCTRRKKEMTQQIIKVLQELGRAGGRTRGPSGSTSHSPQPKSSRKENPLQQSRKTREKLQI